MPLTYPLRLEVQRRLTDLLKTITIANGYHVDIGDNVFRGRGVFGDETPLPALSILEVPIPLDQLPPPQGAPLTSGGWELVVQGWVKDDKLHPTDPAHILLADVKLCLSTEMKKVNWDNPADGILGLGRSVTKLYIGAGVVRPPEEVSAKAYFWLTITLDLAEDLEHPYDE
jgi:hypothetical protein